MQKEKVNIDVYKKLICDMVWELNDGNFLRQIYSILARQHKKDRG